MFPHGVQNPHEYYHTFGDPAGFTDSDATWEQFLSACIANLDNCPFSKYASDTADLEKILDDLFDDIKYNPIPIGTEFIVDYTMVKSFTWGKLYYPKQYTLLVAALEAVLTRNVTTLALALSAQHGSAEPAVANASPEAQQGIKCGDKFLRSDDVGPLEASLRDEIYKASARFGDAATLDMTGCARWDFEAKERYDGDFQVKTSYPALIIGNTWDPVTPIKSAFNISSGFEGSVVLRHNGHGHMSIAQISSCTSKYIADYFINGTLPALDTSCEPDTPLFAMP
ncbi:hypothetical protein P152DRAFT_436309 [Eremomyces bilateralis CBS 781.70]|uniref:Peptidase S33 tripeptidyl aminopeptidase-like C-terminal domain-containing protein n=1 Tax=Eremomyces bilateralis CBS 781.70 TaxID=1392243 RepID=A0A6G1G2D3_9PEZI|nr:uncharacterized protein P152DRAFT_436309 [Eremomyces bilateralis CBS 781.70]KAF1812214.1 hypothetical protein P152DRAFT_436309 [Eremomyces bilateralis CBS 781.70]